MRIIFPYCRDSGGPGQERSVEDQQREIEKWAQERGYVIGRWYVDEARTGSTEKRDEFQRMVAEAIRERPYAVVMWDMARFARNMDAAQFYRSLLRRSGVEVISLKDQIPDGPFGRIFESIIDFSSQHFLSSLSVNVRRGHRATLERGFMPSGRPPLGLRRMEVEAGERRGGAPRIGTKWVADEDLAPVVRQAFEMRASGHTIVEIADTTRLHQSRTGFYAMFRNPVYKGVFRYSGEDWYGLVEPLVDAPTWDAAQSLPKVHPRTAASDYLLTGLLRCGYCGRPMAGKLNGWRTPERAKYTRRYYTCTDKTIKAGSDRCGARLVQANVIEQAVLDVVLTDLLQPEPFRRLIEAVRTKRNVEDEERRLARLDKQIAEIELSIRELIKLVGRRVTAEQVIAELEAQESELRKLKEQRAQINTPRGLMIASDTEIIAKVEELAQKLTAGDTSTKRWVLRQVVAELSWGPNLNIVFQAPL